MSAQPITETWDDLDDFMSQVDQADLATPIDQLLADRMLRRVLRERRKVEMAEAMVDAERARLDEYLAEVRRRHDTTYLEDCLRQFHQAQLDADPKAKTIHLPAGTLTARKRPDRWEFHEDAFKEWAAKWKPELLRTKTEIDKPTAKQALVVNPDGRVLDFDSGEYLDSVTVTPGEITFAVKAGTEEGDS